MKIVVFIRQIVNPQVKLQGVDYFDASRVSEDDLIINPNGKNAIEGALKLKEMLNAEVTAVCSKGLKPNKALREAIAMGCDNAIEVADEIFYTEDPLILAKIYANILEKIGEFDLVLLGVEEKATNSYATAAMLAEKLNLPSVLYAEEIEIQGDKLRVGHVLEGGRKIVEMPMKGIISCSDSQFFIPRYTTMKGILNAKRAEIPIWNATDIGVSASVVGEEAVSLMQVSLSNIIIEKESFIIKEGEPEEQVDELLAKLKEDGIKLGV
ncbi:MAG: electron transfer flavoprotein subunit beta/FixA family protein [Candidatus Thorarchaeota archaeon]